MRQSTIDAAVSQYTASAIASIQHIELYYRAKLDKLSSKYKELVKFTERVTHEKESLTHEKDALLKQQEELKQHRSAVEDASQVLQQAPHMMERFLKGCIFVGHTVRTP